MFQPNPEAIPFGIAVAISAGLAALAWRRRGMPVARAFAVMAGGEAAWAFFEAMELLIVPLPMKEWCFALRASGVVTMILGLLATVLLYTGHDRWVRPRRYAAICAPSLALTVLAWTNPWHYFYWSGFTNEMIGGFWIAMPVYGPGFKAHFAYCYALVAVATALIARAVYRSRGVFRVQASIMLFGVLLPWVVNILDMSEVFGYIYLDITAIAFAVTGLAFVPGVFRYRLLDLTPVAWAAVVEGMNDPVIVIDPDGRVVDLNPAAGRVIGRKAHEILGAGVAEALEGWPELADRLRRIRDEGEASFEVTGPDPRIPAMFDARISRFGAGTRGSGWVVVLRDIRTIRIAEEGRTRMFREQAARAEAEAANRAKDRFLATLSHELRTPLTPILATATAMLERPETPDDVREVMEMIRRNVGLEVGLIDDLLDLTRIRRGKLRLKREAVDAHELIFRVVEICRHDPRAAGLSIVLDLAARRHDVDADPTRLQQVLWNLLKNAIKFTPDGGTITIRSRDGGGGSSDEAGPPVIITVSDTGIGIAPDVLPRIFGLFEQGNDPAVRRSDGLGLGLTISRSIVEQHGGRLDAASDGEGRGATFTLEMPTVSATTMVPTIEPIAPHGTVAPRTLRILLVDDNPDTRRYLAEVLNRRGHEVRSAESMADAFKVSEGVDVNLLLSDIELPDGTGLQLIRKLRETRPIVGIALSGFGSSDDIEMSRSAGFAAHLMKPVDLRALEEAIYDATVVFPDESLVGR